MARCVAAVGLIGAGLRTAVSACGRQRDLALENLALRQQVAVLQRGQGRPRLSAVDRAFWAVLSRYWSGWRAALTLVRPETVIGWHRRGFRLFWTWKSRRTGRPLIAADVRVEIRRMAKENPLWGAPRIHGELLKLGFDVSERTVARHMPKRPPKPNQTWRTFLRNHVATTAAIDFFTIPSATFRVLYGFVVLDLARRRIVHTNVTAHPTAAWTAHQIVQAFPEDTAPKRLIRDRDGIYGEEFQRRVRNMGIEELVIAPRTPKQNAYAERVIGTLRRECIDHVIVVGENHARGVLREYARYYNGSRTHLSLEKDAPVPREVQPSSDGRVVGVPVLGGLHHRYERRAA